MEEIQIFQINIKEIQIWIAGEGKTRNFFFSKIYSYATCVKIKDVVA